MSRTPAEGAEPPEPAEPAEPARSAEPAKSADAASPAQPSFGRWMGAMWLYTGLRFGLFFALWGLLELIGVRGFAGPVLALALSVPLSLVALRKPRAAFTAQLEARVTARQAERATLADRLQADD